MSLLGAIRHAGAVVDARRVPVRDLRRRAIWPAAQSWGPDGPRHLHPPGRWTQVRAARVTDGGMARWGGWETVIASIPAPNNNFTLASVVDGVPYWFTHGASGWYRTDGSLHTALTGAPAQADPYELTGVVFNDFPVINDPEDGIWYWPLSGTVVNRAPDWSADWTCYALRAFREHLIAINTTETGTNHSARFRWSDQAISGAMPPAWVPDAANLAGFRDLTGQKGPLLDGAPLSMDAFALYKATATYTLDYIGPPYIFRARVISTTSGVYGRNCVARVPFGNVVVTGDDVVLNDGQQVRSLMVARLRSWFQRALDIAEGRRLYVGANSHRKEVWVLAPLGGHLTDPTIPGSWEILAWNWERDEWSMREHPAGAVNFDVGVVPESSSVPSWDADSQAWDLDLSPWQSPVLQATPRACYAAGDAVECNIIAPDWDYESGASDEAGRQQPHFIRETWDCGSPGEETTVLGFRPLFNHGRQPSGVSDVVVRFGTQNNASEPIAWGRERQVQQDQGEFRLDISPLDDLVRGRYVSIDVRLTLDRFTVFEGFELLVRDGGRYHPPAEAAT